MKEVVHTVKRAIIMAAGEGRRLQPITLKIPKPLIKVNGVCMIDTVVGALHSNGIYEIYVVVGHLKEQFYKWAKNWPGVQLIDNPYYDKCNNISSLYSAREHLKDCMILDGDQIIYNKEALDSHFVISSYNASWSEEKTNEWLMTVEGGRVKRCSRTGGVRGWKLYSVSRWTADDGDKLKKHLENEFESGNTKIYWDDVPMFCYFDEYALGIHEIKDNDIVEIDNLEELISLDNSYLSYSKQKL